MANSRPIRPRVVREPHNFGIDNSQEFLEDYHYDLSHMLAVERVMPYLRHYGVIDREDQQIVNSNTTSAMKAGHLIDILKHRGKKALNALLMFIQYYFPEAFKIMTGLEPVPCSIDSDILRSASARHRHSSQVMEQMARLIQTLVQSYQKNKTQQDVLRAETNNIRDDLYKAGGMLDTVQQEFERETDMKNEQIKEMSQKILEIRQQNKDLQYQCDQHREEKIKLLEEIDELRQKCYHFQSERNQMMEDTDKRLNRIQQENLRRGSLRDREKEKTCSKLQQELTAVKQELEQCKAISKDDWSNKEIRNLYQRVSNLMEERDRLQQDKEELKQSYSLLEEQCSTSERNTKTFKEQIETMRAEIERAIEQNNRLKKTYEESVQKNSVLQKKVYESASQVRILHNEAYQGRARVTPLVKDPKFEEAVTKEALIDLEESFIPFNRSAPAPLYCAIDDYISPISTSSSESESEQAVTPPTPSTPSKWPTRGHAIFKKNKKPLVLFSPEHLKSELELHLLEEKDSFMSCPYEKLDGNTDVLASLLQGGKLIHYTTEGNGVYQCVGIDILKRCQEEGKGRVLLPLPVEALVRLKSDGSIKPIVLVVKYKDMDDSGIKSPEEKELEKPHQDFRCLYDKLLIDRNESVSSMVHKITVKCAAKDSDTRGCNAGLPRGYLGHPPSSTTT